MISLTTSGNSIIFNFEDNSHYLFDGTIEVPKNSLTLVTDSSNMFTFKKSATNDIFISARYDEVGMSKSELESWFKANAVDTITEDEIQAMIDESISGKADTSAVTQAISEAVSGYADSVLYNSQSKYIEFYHNGTGGTKVYELNASDFVIDGMVDDVRIETISGVSYLVIDFNTASGKEDIQIPLTDIFDPSNYYTKTEVDAIASGKADTSTVQSLNNVVTAHTANTTIHVTAQDKTNWNGKPNAVEVTQAEYDALVSGGTLDSNTFYIITDATPFDPTQYYTSAQTQSAITQAVSGKQDTLIAGSGITIDSANTISCTGGGSITIDPTLDSGSTNAVANSAITNAINNGLVKNDISFSGEVVVGTVNSTNTTDSSKLYYLPFISATCIAYRESRKVYTFKPILLNLNTLEETVATIVITYNTLTSNNYPNIISVNCSNGKLGFNIIDSDYTFVGFLRHNLDYDNLGNNERYGYKLNASHLIKKNTDISIVSYYLTKYTQNDKGLKQMGIYAKHFGLTSDNGENRYKDGIIFTLDSDFKSHTANTTVHITSSERSAWDAKIDTSAITTSVTSSSTDVQVPSAKAVYDSIPTVSNTITSGSTDAISSGAVYDAIGDINTILQSI